MVSPVLLLALLVAVHDFLATSAGLEVDIDLIMKLATASTLTEDGATREVRRFLLYQMHQPEFVYAPLRPTLESLLSEILSFLGIE